MPEAVSVGERGIALGDVNVRHDACFNPPRREDDHQHHEAVIDSCGPSPLSIRVSCSRIYGKYVQLNLLMLLRLDRTSDQQKNTLTLFHHHDVSAPKADDVHA
jgi:hypothetical protein